MTQDLYTLAVVPKQMVNVEETNEGHNCLFPTYTQAKVIKNMSDKLENNYRVMRKVLTSAIVLRMPTWPLSVQCVRAMMARKSSRKATRRQLPRMVVSFVFFRAKRRKCNAAENVPSTKISTTSKECNKSPKGHKTLYAAGVQYGNVSSTAFIT